MDQWQTAIYYLERMAYGRAEQCLRRWVLSHPDDIYSHRELIRCFHKRLSSSGMWHECREFYDSIYNRHNAHLLRRFVLAEQMLYDGREQEAIEEYGAVIKAGLDAPAIRHSLAIAHKNMKQYKEAQKEFDNVLATDPLFLPAVYTYGEWLFTEGRFDRLETLVDKLFSQVNDDVYLIFSDAKEHIARLRTLKKTMQELRKVICLQNEDKISEAALAFWPVFREHKNNCAFIRTMADLLYRNNWLRYGRQRLEDELEGEEALARYAEGLILWYEGNHEEALAAYSQAIENGIEHPLVYYAKALALEALDRKTEEHDNLLHAHTRQPWLVCARARLAENALEQSDYIRAIQLANMDMGDRECALAYDVSGRASVAQLGGSALKALTRQGDAAMALARVESDSTPICHAELLFRRAMVYAADGNISKASQELSEAIKIDEYAISVADEDDAILVEEIAKQVPQNFEAAFACALVPAFLGDLQKSCTRLEELSGRFPANSRIWYRIGKTLMFLGDQHRSMASYRRAIANDPSCKDAITSLCVLLREERDLQGLLELGDELHSETLPLVFALDVAQSEGITDQALDIAHDILKRDPQQPDAIIHVLETMNPEDIEYAQMMKRLTILNPFDFSGRCFIAQRFLICGMPAEGLKRFVSLISDGLDDPNAILLCGLSRMALDVDFSESKAREQKRN